ncbi:IclR family transcriptional regulator [Amycolatopsis deserti]|uniref:IclR family transcriptional regulator n=1 Tax=Amycolatopsis deserti TaxID=185696 RepID=A0ABQ3JF14_9PSEU|nr:helix-turn-helix domain-containing protein [Amycolatopsis deserti]GHF17444.1 IclR family transcriptional regulator [Amycolatopsis deserti]
MVRSESRGGSPAVRRAARVFRELAAHDETMSVAELSRQLDAPKSSVADICGVLTDLGVLARDLDGRLQLGPAIGRIARGLVGGSRLLEVFPRACAQAEGLRGRTVVLAVLADLDVAYLAVRPGVRPLALTLKPGMRMPAWSTGTGRALLSALPVDVVERMHRGRVPESPSGHPFRLAELTAAVTLAQRRGYASNAELGEMELAGTAAVISGLTGCIAAVGSVVDLDQVRDHDEDAEPVRGLARRLAELIQD